MGLAALSGVGEKYFNDYVSGMHGSITLEADDCLRVSDGYEDFDERIGYIDRSSTNGTGVVVPHESVGAQPDIIKVHIDQQIELNREKHLAKVFRSPIDDLEAKPRLDKINEQMKNDAWNVLQHTNDEVLKSILSSYIHGSNGKVRTYEDLRQAVLADGQLRMALGKHLLEKAKADKFDDTNAGEEKQPNHRGYGGFGGKFTSKEYQAVLALSMLDGTFDSEVSRRDQIVFVDKQFTTEIENGRHRLAAVRLLDLANNDKKPQHIQITRRYAR